MCIRDSVNPQAEELSYPDEELLEALLAAVSYTHLLCCGRCAALACSGIALGVMGAIAEWRSAAIHQHHRRAFCLDAGLPGQRHVERT